MGSPAEKFTAKLFHAEIFYSKLKLCYFHITEIAFIHHRFHDFDDSISAMMQLVLDLEDAIVTLTRAYDLMTLRSYFQFVSLCYLVVI